MGKVIIEAIAPFTEWFEPAIEDLLLWYKYLPNYTNKDLQTEAPDSPYSLLVLLQQHISPQGPKGLEHSLICIRQHYIDAVLMAFPP